MIEPILPTAPPVPGRTSASQRWSRVSFVHWRVDPAAVAPLLPAGITPDEFDGSSWVGLIGFWLDRATVLGSPPVPFFGSFAEINVRLYGVDRWGRRGVVFASLEASRLLAVLGARALFSLPYEWSATALDAEPAGLRYRSRRHGDRSARTDFVVRPGHEIVDTELSRFLTARWALFETRFGRTILLRNTHESWRLQSAELVSIDDTLLEKAGVPGRVGRAPDSVLYSAGVTTRFGSILSARNPTAEPSRPD
ncbi:DUF2071 domain-containing protein [Galbitalea soli]|uniref:DUF2071 domain-containing protein n=1 Tax=Galbitalea soli TaxID=1268042 RepID=A0A7C9PLJ2_9MICO|nr:DUF2071 domain-containing protein [Galbitalea soli]NYJ30953.1 hypothetical protein [Galbitalea soli]